MSALAESSSSPTRRSVVVGSFDAGGTLDVSDVVVQQQPAQSSDDTTAGAASGAGGAGGAGAIEEEEMMASSEEFRTEEEGEEAQQFIPSQNQQFLTSIPEDQSKAFEIEGGSPPPRQQQQEDQSSSAAASNRVQAIISFCLDWFFTVLIGFLVVSYWRGTWVLLDLWTCDGFPTDGSAGMVNGESFCFAATVQIPERYFSGWTTYLAGNILLVIGLAVLGMGWWKPQSGDRLTLSRTCLRVLTVYILGGATVCIWHGCWYLIDYFFLPQFTVQSWWASTCLGAFICYLLLAGNSLLAPPAIFLVDGPSFCPPPIGVTILSSYKSIRTPVAKIKAADDDAKDSVWVAILDPMVSYFFLPWPVVGFWRGFWYLMDEYLYGFGDHHALHLSILYSTILALGCLFLASEDIVQYVPTPGFTSFPKRTRLGNEIIGRLRTLVLAIGAVNFWRAVWLVWDEFLGSTTLWSGALGHVLGVVCLLFLGCLSCICAPPSTLGVDAIAVADCADEPLFSNVPVHSEMLYLFSIGRQADSAPVPLSAHLTPILERAATLRFYQQTGSQLDVMTRADSSVHKRLGRRNQLKRINSQFFRSR